MNCLEAQSKIVAFVEDKLNDDEIVEFVRHIRSCENCREELEIYYTLLVGMKQLDEDQELSSNFVEMMEQKLDQDYKHVLNKRKAKNSTAAVIVLAILVLGFFGFEGYKASEYQQEQEAIKAVQSEYYYSDYFGSAMFHTDDYQMFQFEEYVTDHQEEEVPKLTYYERLRTYIKKHPEVLESQEPEEEETSETEADH